MTLLLSLACYGNLSNDIFVEDARFYAALPSTDAFDFALPEGGGSSESPSDWYTATVQTMAATGSFLDTVVGGTAVVAQVPPSERGDDYRVWGPGAWDAYPGSYLQMEMSRTSDLALYTFAFQAAEASSGPWTEFTSGTWQPDSSTPWQGEMTFDYDRLASVTGELDAGLIVARWDEREQRRVALDVDATLNDTPQRFQAGLLANEDGSGRFDFVEDYLVGEDRETEPAIFVSRWDATGAGRTDGVYAGLEFTACWATDGSETWLAVQDDPPYEEGDVTACPFEDIAQPGEL